MQQTLAQWHATLRFATGVTAAFVVCEFMGWFPSFLAAMLTGALLANLPARPPLKMAIGLVLAIAFPAQLAFLLSVWFRGMPFLLFGLVGLCMLLAFHKMLGGGSPLPPLLMLICLATIPVITLTVPAYADLMPTALTRGMIVAMLIIPLVWLAWPERLPPNPAPPPSPLREASRLRLALMSTFVILPLMFVYLLFGLTQVLPVMIGTLLIVTNFDPARGGKHALRLIVANFGGGLCALLLHTALMTTPSLWFLGGLLFLATLAFGARISAGGPMTPVYVIACNAMLVIFGSALAEGPSSLWLWIKRLGEFVLAGAFAVGMMEIAWYRFSPRREATAS
jgi:hypothetical protein